MPKAAARTPVAPVAPPLGGSLVDRLEREVELLSAKERERLQALLDAVGERKAFTQKRPPEERAQMYLPEWFVYGQAAPPISDKYAAWIVLQGHGDPTQGGPDALVEFDLDMRQLDQSYPDYKFRFMNDRQRQDFLVLLQVGWHTGHVQPDVQESRGLDWTPPEPRKKAGAVGAAGAPSPTQEITPQGGPP